LSNKRVKRSIKEYGTVDIDRTSQKIIEVMWCVWYIIFRQLVSKKTRTKMASWQHRNCLL